MSVGAASIKRAASKAAMNAESVSRDEENISMKTASGSDDVKVDEAGAASGRGKAVEAKADSKAASAAKAARGTGSKAAKKTTAGKKTASKKVTSAAIPAISPEVVDKMKLNRNQVCHLTEELPVHLL